MEKRSLAIRNKGVEIILNRMHSHPDEFISRSAGLAPGRWDWLIMQVTRRVENGHRKADANRVDLAFLTDDEVNAMYDKWMSIQGDAFTCKIMRELLDQSDEAAAANTVTLSGGQAAL